MKGYRRETWFFTALLVVSEKAAAEGVPVSDTTMSPDGNSSQRDAELAEMPPSSKNLRDSLSSDRLAILFHVGIGAPGGAIGVDVDLALSPYFAVNTSYGLSFGGPQFATTPRLRIPAGPSFFPYVGTGVSVGRYVSHLRYEGMGAFWLDSLAINGPGPADLEWKRAYWHNIETGFDFYPRQGTLMLHVATGYGYIINSGERRCLDEGEPPSSFGTNKGCDRTTGQSLIYVSGAIGFDI